MSDLEFPPFPDDTREIGSHAWVIRLAFAIAKARQQKRYVRGYRSCSGRWYYGSFRTADPLIKGRETIKSDE